jgi:iron(II)-dependent oxidoreductase
MTPVAEAVPALCAGVGDTGIPAPFVPVVRIPPEGEGVPFTMGGEGGDADELPAHTFDMWPHRLDVREATWEDFARFLSDHGNDCEGHPCVDVQGEGFRLVQEGGFWKPETGAEALPVVHVSWHGATEYCAWRRMILPYEATWEAAASAMGERSYPWGDQAPTCDLALHEGCGAAGPEAVCTREAGNSPQGVCNLAGNVSEWISDTYEADQYATCVAENSCAHGPSFSESSERVIRGGSFATPAHNLRARDRNFANPATTAADLGVRCMAGNPSW